MLACRIRIRVSTIQGFLTSLWCHGRHTDAFRNLKNILNNFCSLQCESTMTQQQQWQWQNGFSWLKAIAHVRSILLHLLMVQTGTTTEALSHAEPTFPDRSLENSPASSRPIIWRNGIAPCNVADGAPQAPPHSWRSFVHRSLNSFAWSFTCCNTRPCEQRQALGSLCCNVWDTSSASSVDPFEPVGLIFEFSTRLFVYASSIASSLPSLDIAWDRRFSTLSGLWAPKVQFFPSRARVVQQAPLFVWFEARKFE